MVTVEYPDIVAGEKNGEYVPLESLSLGHARLPSLSTGEEEGEGRHLLASPSHSTKKPAKGSGRTRISSKSVLDILDVSGIYIYIVIVLSYHP